MLIYFRCEKCRQKYKAKPQQIGRKASCKKCGAKIQVPDLDEIVESTTCEFSTGTPTGILQRAPENSFLPEWVSLTYFKVILLALFFVVMFLLSYLIN